MGITTSLKVKQCDNLNQACQQSRTYRWTRGGKGSQPQSSWGGWKAVKRCLVSQRGLWFQLLPCRHTAPKQTGRGRKQALGRRVSTRPLERAWAESATACQISANPPPAQKKKSCILSSFGLENTPPHSSQFPCLSKFFLFLVTSHLHFFQNVLLWGQRGGGGRRITGN